MRSWVQLLLVVGMVSGAGCSSNRREAPANLIPVAGIVILESEPAANVTLHFIPAPGTNSQGGYAVTDLSGHYRVKHLSNAENADGLEKGAYRITFSKLASPDGSPIPEGRTAADVGAVESMPPHLSVLNEENPLFVLEVDAPKTDANFDLKKKPGR